MAGTGTGGPTSVVSMCTAQHIDVWRHTSQLLPECLLADEYTVYVPSNDLEKIREVTDPRIQVLSEESLGHQFKPTLLEATAAADNLERFNWYFQQFLKIEALRRSPAYRLVIWDADCVPIVPIRPFHSSGKPVYMGSPEFNRPYFEQIQRLLGIGKVRDESFIVPAFPIPKLWLTELLSEIERKHPGSEWHEALISTIDFSLGAGFSEFEMMGTWVASRHAEEWVGTSLAWERGGQSRFGCPGDLDLRDIQNLGRRNNLDVISFETWDSPDSRSFMLRTRSKLMRLARRPKATGYGQW